MKKNGLLRRIFSRSATPDNTPTEPPAPAEPPAPPAPTQKTEVHKVAGVSFRQDILQSFAVENEDYPKSKRELIDDGLTDEWIYKYDFYPCQAELVPEPENPEDPKAVKVVADGQHIGYIKSGSCAHIHKLLKSGRILALTCEIGGGPSKKIAEDVDERGKSSYSIEQRSLPFYATLSITVAL